MTTVYIVGCKAGQTKVGMAEVPKMRLPQLQRTMDCLLYFAHVFYCTDNETAFALERRIHTKLSGCSLGNEWFRCIPEEAIVAGLEVIERDYYRDYKGYVGKRAVPTCKTKHVRY